VEQLEIVTSIEKHPPLGESDGCLKGNGDHDDRRCKYKMESNA